MNNLRVPAPSVNPDPFRPLVRSVERAEFTNVDNYPLLAITRGNLTETYGVVALSTDLGGCAFRLLKCGSDATYEVLMNGTESSCSCAGFTYTDSCKHVAALAAVLDNGSLAVAPGSAASDLQEGE